jgi:LAO/AO transport system kinase
MRPPGVSVVLEVSSLVPRVLARERAAIAAALNLIEDTRDTERARAAELLSSLESSGAAESSRKTALRVGITGPPGVGKSTLVSALIGELRKSNRTVGVVAVDPSSLRSGGALLGDRARVALDPNDNDVFFRSLASHGELGGLTENAFSVARLLSATFDVVLVETTGVGQNETDVRDIADVVLLVVQPGSGDTLQFLKAGIMEIPDVIVVNKADEEKLANEALADVRRAVSAETAAGVRHTLPEMLATSALERQGIVPLIAAIDAARGRHSDEAFRNARLVGAEHWVLRGLRRRLGSEGVEGRGGGESQLRARVRADLASGLAPEAVMLTILRGSFTH